MTGPKFISWNIQDIEAQDTSASSSSLTTTSLRSRVTLTTREKADRRNLKARQKQAQEKAERDTGEEADEEEVPVKRRKRAPKNKAHKHTPTEIFNSSDNNESDPPKKFTIYIDIEGLKPTPTASHSKGPALAALTINKGPFFHLTNESFTVFKQHIANLTPCNVNLLVLSKLTWKFDKPLAAPRKLVTNDVGYDAMLSSMLDKRGDCVIFVYMPLPAKDVVSYICPMDCPRY